MGEGGGQIVFRRMNFSQEIRLRQLVHDMVTETSCQLSERFYDHFFEKSSRHTNKWTDRHGSIYYDQPMTGGSRNPNFQKWPSPQLTILVNLVCCLFFAPTSPSGTEA